MRPERMAQIIAETLKSVIAPLAKQIEDLKGENNALEARLARLQSAHGELQKDFLATVRQLDLLPRGDGPKIDFHAHDPRH